MMNFMKKGIPMKNVIKMNNIHNDLQKKESEEQEMKMGIIYEPTILTILNHGSTPEFVKVDNSIRKLLLTDQIETIAAVNEAYNTTNCNIDTLTKAYYTSLEAMIQNIVDNHIHELKFMICQLGENIRNILKYHFQCDDNDLREIQSILPPYDMDTYRENIIIRTEKIADLPDDTKKESYAEGLELCLMSNFNYISQIIWNNIEANVLFMSNYNLKYNIDYNNIMKDTGFEFCAFMMGSYASINKLYVNLANPIGIGGFSGAPGIPESNGNYF